METLLPIVMGILLWDIIKQVYRNYKRSKYPGFRVEFTATVSSMDETYRLLDHILKVPKDDGFVMYDVDYKVVK